MKGLLSIWTGLEVSEIKVTFIRDNLYRHGAYKITETVPQRI